MFVRISGLGANGVVSDTVGEALASGTWTDALNIRFTGVELQKMLEPLVFSLTTPDGGITQIDGLWMQTWADGLSTYLAVASLNKIWLFVNDNINQEWEDVSRAEGYSDAGVWDSFAWGDTAIFNNGIDPPQIYNSYTGMFEDLPNWGLISSADDILNNNPPSIQVTASCVRLAPFRSFLVAVGVTENGLYQPNKVWWSDTTNLAGYAGAPNWDYETPASLSGQIVIDPEGGAIRSAANLNDRLIIYTAAGATAMLNIGGALVMQFRRLFNKGAAGLHCVAEFNNQHFVVASDQIYIHDGSTVQLLAKDRVEEDFFVRVGKGGRFGSGSVDWNNLQVAKNPDRKEVYTAYDDISGNRRALVWNFDDNNFTWMDASTEENAALDPVLCMHYGFVPGWVVRWSDLQEQNISWQDLADGNDPWSGFAGRDALWSDLYEAGLDQNMYWLTKTAVWTSDQVIDKTGFKEYFAERVAMDFDDILGSTSNTYKHVRQIYPLMQSPSDAIAPNTYDFQIGWSNNLMDDIDYQLPVTINLLKTAETGKHKIDVRSTGRYMGMRWDFGLTDELSLTAMDIDIEQAHGR